MDFTGCQVCTESGESPAGAELFGGKEREGNDNESSKLDAVKRKNHDSRRLKERPLSDAQAVAEAQQIVLRDIESVGDRIKEVAAAAPDAAQLAIVVDSIVAKSGEEPVISVVSTTRNLLEARLAALNGPNANEAACRLREVARDEVPCLYVMHVPHGEDVLLVMRFYFGPSGFMGDRKGDA